ncbi:MAG TPA: enoyl-CoA hydratase-related protein [Xanthomonadaceae bacterium]|nr:enoyl-CoA hydratase-related protein [Xanthomonadaceae bacterium]
MPGAPTLAVQVCDAVATLTLSRPEVHNAFDAGLVAELTDALQQVGQRKDVRAVVLTGAGSSFSAGADLNWMKSMAAAGEAENREDAARLALLMRVLDTLDKPTIARVNGAAYGGGVGLVACCDVAIASRSARFGLTEVCLGLVPAVISPYVVAAVGVRHARRLFLTAGMFDADEAERIGLVHRAVEPEVLDEAVRSEVDRILDAGPVAVREAKALLHRLAGPDAARRDALDRDNAELIARLRVSEEGQQGLAAFFDTKRPPWVR